MKTTAAIRAVMMNVLSIAENQPTAVKMSHMARIAPRIVPIIRPMCLWYAPGALWRAGRAGQATLDGSSQHTQHRQVHGTKATIGLVG
jgi:hypothetical protein